jgi:hypothetical protein
MIEFILGNLKGKLTQVEKQIHRSLINPDNTEKINFMFRSLAYSSVALNLGFIN